MWTVVYIASNVSTAEVLKKELIKEGILVDLRAVGSFSLTEGERSVEILVPESEAEEAHQILNLVLAG